MVVHPKIIPFFVIAHGNDALHLAYTGAPLYSSLSLQSRSSPLARRRPVGVLPRLAKITVALARVCRFAV